MPSKIKRRTRKGGKTNKRYKKETKPRKKSTLNTSKFKGVTWLSRQQRWLARARWQGHLHYVGNFVSEVDAAKARDFKLIQLNNGTADGIHEDEFNFPVKWLVYLMSKDDNCIPKPCKKGSRNDSKKRKRRKPKVKKVTQKKRNKKRRPTGSQKKRTSRRRKKNKKKTPTAARKKRRKYKLKLKKEKLRE